MIPVGNTPHGIVIDPAGIRLYAANEPSNTVPVIDTTINTVVATIPAWVGPFQAEVNPDP